MRAPSLAALSKVGEGREAEIFDWDAGRVLRLLRPGFEAWRLEREATALSAAHAAGAPVPIVHERVSVDGRPGLVMERLDGQDLLTRLGSKPWTGPAAARLLGRLHAELHAVIAPDELPAVKDVLRQALASELVPSELAATSLQRLDDLPDGDRLCHGDFHPANVLLTPHGPRVIDWHAGTRGHPAADVARTRILVGLAVVPGGGSFVVRRVGTLGRRVLLAGYLWSYRRVAPIDPKLVESWEAVLMVARLAEGIDEERDNLLRLLASP
jgi:aminoglycoside phosphotransferase (APT) family kinase protein